MSHLPPLPGPAPQGGMRTWLDRARGRAAPRRLVFHVGDFKTGSTSIQVALDRGLVTVPGHRLLFPGHVDHRPLARTLGGDGEAAHRDARWGDLADRLAAPDWDTAVVSSEQFEFYPPEALDDAVSAYLPEFRDGLRVILYLRPHGARTVSTWAEHLKQGFTTDPLDAKHEALLRRERLFYADRVARWRAVFGEALIVRPMIRSELWQGDVVADFFRLALAREDMEIAPLPPQNERLDMGDLSLLRELHLILRARDPELGRAGHAFAWQFARFLSQRPPAPPFPRPALHRALALRLAEDYGADAQALDERVFGRPLFAPALAADVETAAATPQPVEAQAWHDAQTVRLAQVWGDMLAHALSAGDLPLLAALERPRDP